MPTHPSDENKDVRWMGHSFILSESALPVQNCYKTLKNRDKVWFFRSLLDAGGHVRRQREMKPAAFAWRAFGPDAAAVLLNDAAAEGEAKAGAAQSARVRSVALLEALEDALQLLGRDAAALVFHGE